MAETIKIGGELESMATGGVVAAASAIKDKTKDKYQSEINQEVSQALSDRYTKDKVYSKEQTDAKIEAQIVDTTTREKYDTFSATNEDVSTDTILPGTGSEDTIYRVTNWDGTGYNTSYWSQYAWKQDTEDTGHYVRLAVKNQGLDTTPTPNSLNLVSSGGVADACGHLEECPEYLKVETDAEDKILHSVSAEDGAYYFHKIKSPTLDTMMEDMQAIKGEAEAEVQQAIEDSQDDLAAHYDYYNVSKHHSVRDVVDVYTANEGWEQIEYDSSLTQYDELDVYQVGETCNFGGDTEHSYEATISQRGVAPATITQEYETRTKFTLEEALAVLPAAVISTFAAGQRICFVDLNDFIEEWQITEGGAWEKISPYDIKDPENRIEIKLDAESKIVAYRKADGTWVECVGIEAPNLGEYVEKEEGKGLINSEYAETVDVIDDPEGRLHLDIDAENKIVSERDRDGRLHLYVGIETKELTFSGDGLSRFEKMLKDDGFNPGGSGDYTDKKSMYIPEPRLAHLNIITDFNLTTLTKSSDVKCQVEFYDGAGNYFKKWIILNGQGRSSLSFMKKGLGADFFNEDPNSETFDEDNVFSMKFGNWVYQDSFHIKSYYTDFPRCTSPVVYKLTDEVVRTRGVMNDRPYKKYYVGEYSDAANVNTQSDLDKNMETGARCFPDGFPVIVYQNGNFWGVNAWQLKKHRDNYMLSKKKATHIHLDGDMGTRMSATPFWLWDGTIDWTVYCSGSAGIETRNPKNLYCIDGKKYDVDTHDAEIIDTATAEEWITAGQIIPTGKVIDDTLAGYLRTTGKVRASIEELTTYVPTINQMVSGGATAEEIRTTIEDMFDVDSFIDYILIGNVCGNNDAWDNNGQIVTWGKLEGSDRLNWSVNMYDCDITFGCRWDGISASAANNTKLGSTYPLYKIFWDYYYDELKARYHELRDKGVFDADHITQLFRSWMDRVGYDNYIKEYEKWDESPCFRDGSQTYTNYPTTGGFYGSIERIYLWVKKRIQYMDAANFFDYNN